MITVNFLQILSLFKKYWREILIIALAGVVILKMRVDYNSLEAAHETTQKELQEQIIQLNEIHAEETEKKDKALEVYKSAMENLEKDYETQKKRNKELSKERKVKLVTTFSHNKEEFANEINNIFGFEYVP